MKQEPIINVTQLSKGYTLYNKPIDLLYEVISGKPRHDIFWALKNINFELYEGQRVGIIGANGSGKSTLLKIITGNLRSTYGSIKVNGTISSMLSLNSSLNENETGLENIKFNLLMKGISKSELSYYITEIIDFTELGHFIYAPVKTYSTGMHARLSFALSTVIAPDILIIDEVLSVGDGYFVGKAIKRMLELCQKGRGLLFVSHALNAIQMLCDTAIWLDKGILRMQGPVGQVIKCYEEDFRQREDFNTREGNKARRQSNLQNSHVEDFADSSIWRLRIVPESGQKFHDVHYIKSTDLIINDKKIPVSFELNSENLDLKGEAYLDILDSEWGRLFERDGQKCFTLSSSIGKRKGGHILICKPELASTEVEITIDVICSSAMGSEMIGIDFLNEKTGDWQSLTSVEVKDSSNPSLKHRWQIKRFHGFLLNVDIKHFQAMSKKVFMSTLPNVIIRDAYITVDGEITSVIIERTPFCLTITAEVIRNEPKIDFGVRFIRSDGVYVFWQSSGQSNMNIVGEVGVVEINFEFQPNLFSSGRYDITVYAANGWNVENNYPYSEVFDRKINILALTIIRENEMIDYGIINHIYNVKFNNYKTVELKSIQEASLL